MELGPGAKTKTASSPEGNHNCWLGGLSSEMISGLREQRHQVMNDLQVISGWIQLGKDDRALEYIGEVRDRMNYQSALIDLQVDDLHLLLLRFSIEAQARGIPVRYFVERGPGVTDAALGRDETPGPGAAIGAKAYSRLRQALTSVLSSIEGSLEEVAVARAGQGEARGAGSPGGAGGPSFGAGALAAVRVDISVEDESIEIVVSVDISGTGIRTDSPNRRIFSTCLSTKQQ